jgi:hypothetical protein
MASNGGGIVRAKVIKNIIRGFFMFNIRMLASLVAVISISSPALAQEMRCGEKLIAGDQIQPLIKEQVLEVCGEPTEKGYDRWYYKEQHKILIFNGDGELDHIEDAAVTE